MQPELSVDRNRYVHYSVTTKLKQIINNSEVRKGTGDIMGGNILTLPSDYIEEGRKEGRLNEIFSSVQEGDYSAMRGAQKAEMSIDQFEKAMLEAGYKIPTNV